MSTPKPFKAWCAFSEGKPVIINDYIITGKQYWIYTTRKAARCRFEDVRRVEIREIKPKGKRA